MSANISVIILTYNEEKNIRHSIQSAQNWAKEIFLVDSFSTDSTIKIAEELNTKIYYNAFENYSSQRNFALEKLPIETEWIFFLDADEILTKSLKEEITNKIVSNPKENGFMVKYKLIWMGKWIKQGYYPTWLLRMFRTGQASCELRNVNEHFILNGNHGYLKNDFIHDDRKGISEWINKHNKYSTYEAKELFNRKKIKDKISINLFGSQAEKKRWIRYHIWDRLPLLIRPFIYFFYRYFIKLGILDGIRGFIFHFLQAFWFYLLIDIKYLELKREK